MRGKSDDGFSIIELLLFVTISSLFVIIGLRYLSGRTAEVQFTDSIRDIENRSRSVLQKVRDGALSEGINCVATGPVDNTDYRITTATYTRNGGTPTSDGSCIFIGTLIDFGDYFNNLSDTEERRAVRQYEVIGRRLSPEEMRECLEVNELGVNASDYDLHRQKNTTLSNRTWCTSPFLIPSPNVDEQLSWGTEIFGGKNASRIASHNIGFLKEPDTGRLMPYSYNEGADYLVDDVALQKEFFDVRDPHPGRDIDGVSPSSKRREAAFDVDVSGYMCFQSPDKKFQAALSYANHFQQTSIDVIYDHKQCDDLFASCPPESGIFQARDFRYDRTC